MSATSSAARERVTTLIVGATLVTLDAQRRIFRDGALAIRDERIVAVGAADTLRDRFEAQELIDGRRFVITPGFVDAHIHITGDPLTRNYIPDDIDAPFEEKLSRWVIPRFTAQTPEDELLSAQLAAVQMLRSGTTCFLEAGTVRHLDAVVEGLRSTGIRGRVGEWVEGRERIDGRDQSAATDRAIGLLEREVARYPARDGARIAAWPLLVGHTTNTDEVWRAAKRLADANGLGVSAHMSPFRSDPEWYLANLGCRPIEHLAKIGALGPNVALTHLAHISEQELELLRATRTNAILCPLAALRGGFGIAAVGRFPEMSAAGINIALGSDGDVPDLMQKIRIAAAIFKDARQDTRLFPAHEVLAMGIEGGARLLQLGGQIGSLEAGKKADFVLHDTDRPEWQPRLNVLHQLVWAADGRAVHSVWVDGVRVVDNYRCTRVDEQDIYRRGQQAALDLIKRSGVPSVSPWPVT
jgi:cytosine/adenosine deaminase-related metal-dependent hydrolase